MLAAGEISVLRTVITDAYSVMPSVYGFSLERTFSNLRLWRAPVMASETNILEFNIFEDCANSSKVITRLS